MSASDDQRWMRLALALGRRGQGNTWPNPAVGCVITRGDWVLGRGWTQPGGRPHAETHALDQAGASAHGATVYVTLEPCNHTGQTPPCAQSLIDAGVARVVVALGDPDPRTDGAGLARLGAAGIAIETGVCKAEAARDHEGFVSRVTTGRPSLTLKLAASLDGRIATATGESQWITGPAARAWVHGARARHDAVLVGAGTARADDPMLSVRGMGNLRQPVRVVLSRRLDLPRDSALARTARDIPVWLLHGPDAPTAIQDAWRDLGARLIPVRCADAGQIDLGGALATLGAAGINRVFCEGGGNLAAALLAGDHVDDLAVMTAGLAIGAEGTPALAAMGIAALSEAPKMALERCEILGPDVLSLWRRQGINR